MGRAQEKSSRRERDSSKDYRYNKEHKFPEDSEEDDDHHHQHINRRRSNHRDDVEERHRSDDHHRREYSSVDRERTIEPRKEREGIRDKTRDCEMREESYEREDSMKRLIEARKEREGIIDKTRDRELLPSPSSPDKSSTHSDSPTTKVSSISTPNENKGVNINRSHEVPGKSSTDGTAPAAGKSASLSLDALAKAKRALQVRKELAERLKKLPLGCFSVTTWYLW